METPTFEIHSQEEIWDTLLVFHINRVALCGDPESAADILQTFPIYVYLHRVQCLPRFSHHSHFFFLPTVRLTTIQDGATSADPGCETVDVTTDDAGIGGALGACWGTEVDESGWGAAGGGCWLRKATLAALIRAAGCPSEGQGDRQGVEQWLLLKSHWSKSLSSSSGEGPPSVWAAVVSLAARSNAVVRSHIWMAPLLWPVKIKRRGREPIRLEPSHSCTQNEVMLDPSTDRITQTLKPEQTILGANPVFKIAACCALSGFDLSIHG